MLSHNEEYSSLVHCVKMQLLRLPNALQGGILGVGLETLGYFELFAGVSAKIYSGTQR